MNNDFKLHGDNCHSVEALNFTGANKECGQSRRRAAEYSSARAPGGLIGQDCGSAKA
jgi:hypothetical protein